MTTAPVISGSDGVRLSLRRGRLATWLGLTLSAGALWSGCAIRESLPPTADRNVPTASARSMGALGSATSGLPLYFERNEGQAPAGVGFISRGPGHALWLSSDEAILAGTGARGERAGLRLDGARQGVAARGVERLPGTVNYIIGNDPRAWRTDVPTFAGTRFDGVYEGIDVVYHGRQGHLEFDFVVAPHADPGQIRVAVTGPGDLRLDADGSLVLSEPRGQVVRLAPPVVYQEIAGVRREVPGRYVREGARDVRFAVGDYDRRVALVIDPIVYATFLGGSAIDGMTNLRLDGAGNIVVLGSTRSFDYPLVAAFQSTNTGLGTPNGVCFISKLNPSGSALIYSTYLGGSGDNACNNGTVDTAGNVYVTGATSAFNYPVTPNALQPAHGGGIYDAYVAKLNPAGSALLYSSYIGGSGFDNARGIAASDAGSVWISGMTSSTNFPVKNAAQGTYGGGICDAFVIKIDTNQAGAASLVFGTYFGGSGSDNGGFSGGTGLVDGGLAIDLAGNVVVTGSTASTNLAVLNALQPTYGGGDFDAFVLKLDGNGAKVYATYLGGTLLDVGFTVGLDRGGFAYVSGISTGGNFPLKNPVQGTFGGGESDAFLAKVSPSGQLVFSTFIGGNGNEFPGQIVVDGAGNSYIAGNTSSTNFPLKDPVQGTYGGGDVDAWIMVVNPTGTYRAFSTYLGGTGSDTGFGIMPDGAGNVVAGLQTTSTVMPLVSPIQNSNHGAFDSYIAKMTLPNGLVSSILPISRSVQTGGTATVFATIINTGTDAATGCSILPVSALPVTPLYQTTNPATNALTGTPNTPANIAAGDFQTFLIALTANAAFSPSDVAFSFGCTNRASATVIPGVNTLLLSASDSPVPDIVALGLTPSGDGIVNVPGVNGTGFFTVATSNVGGAGGTIRVKPDTGGVALPVNLFVCQTDPGTGACIGALQPEVFATINPGQTPTFAVFAQGTGTAIPFNPGANRLFLRFYDGGNAVRGATSAALRTQ